MTKEKAIEIIDVFDELQGAQTLYERLKNGHFVSVKWATWAYYDNDEIKEIFKRHTEEIEDEIIRYSADQVKKLEKQFEQL